MGKLDAATDGSVAFDIWSDGNRTNVGWLLAGGNLHTVELATGAAKLVGAIAELKGKVTDIAILQAM